MNNLKSDVLREKVLREHNLEEIVLSLMKTGEIERFNQELWDKIKETNVPMLRDMYLLFEEGENIGTCGVCARYLSFSFSEFTLVEYGFCNVLIGTKGSPIGQHAWLESDGYIYDTTLLLKIEKEVGYSILGYTPKETISSIDLFSDRIYVTQKEYSRDKEDLKFKRDYRDELKRLGFKCSLLGLY